MNEISKQVARARRRLLIGRFFRVLCWSAFAGLLVAAIGMAIPKIWHLELLGSATQLNTWIYSWIGGGLGVALLVAGFLTWQQSESNLEAAVELDRRFGLKERISSAISLDAQTADSEAGKALINDASKRAETVDVRDQFAFQPSWRAAMPLIPALVIGILFLIPNAEAKAAKDPVKTTVNKREVKNAIEQAKKKLKKKAEQATTKGLKDALAKLDSLDKKLDEISKGSTDEKKQALIKLNDVKKQVMDRQEKIGGAAEMKESLKRLSQINKGPAKQIAEAMKSGDLKQAQKAIKELAEKLKSGKLSETEKKQLAKDLQQLADQIKKMAEKHEQKKQELKEQIRKAQQQGDMEKAAQLQQQLEKMKQQDQQKEQMKKMAQKLQKCAECMKQGGQQQKQGGKNAQKQPGQQGNQQAQAQMKEAGEALEDLAQQLEGLQQQLEELEDLEDLQQDLENIKQGMQGGNCEGQGDKPNWQDWAKGRGPGGGKRDKEEGETGGYKSKVKAKLKRGETVVTGSADGANITGSSIKEAREAVRASMELNSDPLSDQKLPRNMREHAEEYFKNLRDN